MTKPAWKGEKGVWATACAGLNETVDWKRHVAAFAVMKEMKRERADADAAVNRDGAVAEHDGAMAVGGRDARKAGARVDVGAHRRHR